MPRALLCLSFLIAVFSASYSQEQEYLQPTQQVTFGNNQHTSRDAVWHSKMNSRGELILVGYTERDFTFSDVLIMALDKDLKVLWSDRLSWDGISYDFPVGLLIDKEDHIWVMSTNLVYGTSQFIITRYDPSGKKLWEYMKPEPVANGMINMNDTHFFLDEEGYLNFVYGGAYNAVEMIPVSFRISPDGQLVTEKEVFPHILVQLSNDGNVNHGLHYEPYATEQLYYYVRFTQTEKEKYLLDLSSHLNLPLSGLIEGNTSTTDKKGNFILVTQADFNNRDHTLHQSVVVLSVNKTGGVNYAVDHDPNQDKYLLDFMVTEENNLVVVTNSQPIEIDNEEPLLTLEIFSETGELLYYKKSETAVGNFASIKEDKILVRDLNGSIQVYDHKLNLLSSQEAPPYEGRFFPQELYQINGSVVLAGSTVAKRYPTSDFESDENIVVRKFDQNGLSGQMIFNGEGTSKIYTYEMITDEVGNIIVSGDEHLGPSNLHMGGTKAPRNKKILKYSPTFELLEDKIVESTEIWEEPKTEFEGPNGELNSYVFSEDKKNISFYINQQLQWSRQLELEHNEEIFRGRLDKENNLVFASYWYGENSRIHKLTPENKYAKTEHRNLVKEYIILSNNWIFVARQGVIVDVYSPDLKLLKSVQLDLDKDSNIQLLEKNNKVLLKATHTDQVLVLNQFAEVENEFNMREAIHPSVAFFDKNDNLIVYHTIGKGIYLAHGHNWSRGALSRYNIKQFIGDYNNGDSDADGIPDDVDQCPGTPEGADINEFGCELLKLDADYFTLRTRDETCPGKKNGRLEILAAEEGAYVVVLHGEIYEFTTGISFEKLVPGNYEACVWVKGEEQTRRCYNFQIAGGERLQAQAVVNTSLKNKELQVNILSGTGPFNLYINGKIAGTFPDPVFNIAVRGGDEVEVRSAVNCEGDFKMIVGTGDDIRLFPNPVGAEVHFELPEIWNEAIYIEIFNASGQRVRSVWQRPFEREVKIPAVDLDPGVYFLRIYLQEVKTIKIIKS